MAYEGGGLSAIWKPDLTTRAGAMNAVNSAKFGFLIVGCFRLLMYAVVIFTAYKGSLPSGPSSSIVVGIWLFEAGLPLLAAWKLHLYKGAYIAPVATLFFILGVLTNMSIIAIVIGVIFIGAFISGVRGAWALKRGTGFDDDLVDTFA